MKKIIIYLMLLILHSNVNNLHAQIILGELEEGLLNDIKYYEPVDDYSNQNIATKTTVDSNNHFKIQLNIVKPCFIRIEINKNVANLFIEPNDTIHFIVKKSTPNIRDWFMVSGNNAVAHYIFNTTYNFYPISKFMGIRDVFSLNKDNKFEILWDSLKTELLSQVFWIDSLYKEKKITSTYYEYVKTDIISILGTEIIKMCQGSFKNSDFAHETLKPRRIIDSLFRLVDPFDEKLKSGLYGYIYTYNYYNYIYNLEKPQINMDSVYFKDNPELSIGSYEFRKMIYGRDLLDFYFMFPDAFDYCSLYYRYKSDYGQNAYTDAIEKIDYCKKKDSKSIYILEDESKDLFTLLQSRFMGRRLFIDIWATWCIPCKNEFKYYDEDFKKFMKKKKVDLLFISIDSLSKKNIWENQIRSLNLEGSHILANKDLIKSIKEIIFGDKQLFVIPRYIIINEFGQILSVDAKRPSDLELRNEISTYFHR